MISPQNEQDSRPSEPVRTGSNPLSQEWLDVAQAVVRCAELGLIRTPKTVRKWAERSAGLADGDVISRKEDTPWGGYRWLIEKASLTRKVEEELELRGPNQDEPVRTAPNVFEPSIVHKTLTEPGANTTDPVHTGVHEFDQVVLQNELESPPEPGANQFEPVQTSSEIELVLGEVRERLADKDREISFLRDQLADAQVEIGKRAASTDEALKTIDRVVRSFELQAEANRALALGSANPEPATEQTEQIRFTAETVDNTPGHQDIRRV